MALGFLIMTGFHCATCGKYHDEMPMCLGAPAPALWYSIPASERDGRCELSSDQCIIDSEHYFVLGRVLIPVTDSDDPFIWLCWVSLSRRNFERATELWEVEGRESEPPYFGWIQSALPYEESTLSLSASVFTQKLGERPSITLHESTHPLFLEQENGITLARVQKIVEAALHGGKA